MRRTTWTGEEGVQGGPSLTTMQGTGQGNGGSTTPALSNPLIHATLSEGMTGNSIFIVRVSTGRPGIPKVLF